MNHTETAVAVLSLLAAARYISLRDIPVIVVAFVAAAALSAFLMYALRK